MPELQLTQSAADELLRDAHMSGPVVLSSSLCNEIITGLPVVPIDPPPVGGGEIPTYIAPFSKVIGRKWTWNTPLEINTAYEPDGPLTPQGIVVISFVAQPGSVAPVKVWVAAYPGNLAGCERSCSVSTVPGDFSQPFPWTVYDDNAGLNFYILPTAIRGYPSIPPGVNYYINICSRNRWGGWTAPDAGDMRVRIG